MIYKITIAMSRFIIWFKSIFPEFIPSNIAVVANPIKRGLMTEKTVDDIFNKNDFSDASVLKTVVDIRQYDKRLGFSQKWVTDFVYQIVMLAKKEPKPKEENTTK